MKKISIAEKLGASTVINIGEKAKGPLDIIKQARIIERFHDNNERIWPISKYSKKTGWIFVKHTKTVKLLSALKQASALQKKDKKFKYSLWDNRE